jgi:MFS-type transporter involved in bile tolerance (Atg22 family)
LAIFAASTTQQPLLSVALLSLAYGAIAFQQSVACAVSLDLGHAQAGAVFGLFNMVSQAGGFVGSVAYGYIIRATGSFDAPFYPMIAVLLIGVFLWSKLDAAADVPLMAA